MVDDLLLGRTVAGRYRLISRLGGDATGFGSAVYLARHVVIDRLSAIKVLTGELAPERHVDTEALKAAFLRQARAVNRINHPNLVEISDYGETSVTRADGTWVTLPFLVMEYVPGDPLRRLIERGPLPADRVLSMAVQLSSALARAHQTGVIHRDVRAENVLVLAQKGGHDLIKLTDFGMSRIVQRGNPDGEQGPDRRFGQLGYVPPDIVMGSPVFDARVDIWCLGVLLYEALTGAHPFEGETPAERQARALDGDPTPPSARGVASSRALDALVMACLARDPDKRPRDAYAVLEMLDAASMVSHPETLRSDRLDKTLWDRPPLSRADKALGARSPSVRPDRPDKTIGERRPSTRPEEPDDEEITEIQEVPPELLATMMAAQPPHHEPETARRIPVSIPDTQQVTRRMLELPDHETLSPMALARAWREFWDSAAPGQLEALSLLASLEAAAQQVDELQHGIDAIEAQVRVDRAELGRDIDELAANLSRTHGHMLQLRIRYHEISSARAVVPPNMRPSLDHERQLIADDLARTEAEVNALGARIGHVQDQLHARNLAHEGVVGSWIATLEGALAGLVRLHRELLDHAAYCK